MSRTLGDPREVGPLGMSKDPFLSDRHRQRTLLRSCAAPIIVLVLGTLAPCLAQERLGKPLIHNYSRRDFGAEVQHWDVIQDRRGVMYFANNAGVLEYDGRTWRLIELPSRLGVRSLAMDDDGRIYVGARGDFGYLGADARGQLEFISLLPSEARDDPSFDQLFTPTPAAPGDVYFQARTKLCHFDRALACREIETVSRIFSAAGRLYVQQEGGLMQLVGGSLQRVRGGEQFTGSEIMVLLAYSVGDREGILIGTQAWELFLQRGESFEPLRSPAADRVGEDELLDGAVLQDGSFALATMLRGVIIVDERGAVLQQIDQASGLQDNHVHAVLPDRQGGLWLGLQKGVSRVEVASPFTVFDEGSGLEREWREIIEHEETLYVRGYKGLFAASLAAVRRRGGASTPALRSLLFNRITDIEPPVWSFVSAEGRLLVSSRAAVHEVHGQRARRVVTYPSVPRTLYRSRLNPRRVYVGLSEGVASLRLTDGVWRDEGRIDGIDETITSIAEGENGALWLVSLRQRVIRIDFTEARSEPAERRPNLRSRRVTAYPLGEAALTGRISIREVGGQPLFVTDSGIFRFDEASERFVPFANLAILADAGRRSFSWITEDARGNLWVASRRPGRIDFLRKQSNGDYAADNFGLRQTLAWSIYTAREGTVVWLCTPDYLLRYDPSIRRVASAGFRTLLRKVSAGDGAVIYGGAPITRPAGATAPDDPAFPYRANSLQFEFAAPRFQDTERNEFQSYLEGFDPDWSGWTTDPIRGYTNLPRGHYRFHVRARDVQGRVGQPGVFTFSILPPWYQTGWAYAVYALLLGGLLVVISKVERKRAHLKLQRHLEHMELETLRDLDRMKSRFFTDISHEFRTPLTLILAPVGQMIDEATEPALVQRLRLVHRNAQYLLRLISQLLDLSKLESGKVRLRAMAGDLVQSVEGIVTSFADAAEGQGIDLTLDVRDPSALRDAAPIYFDGDILQKILNNLVGNALKFTPPGGVVSVVVRPAQGRGASPPQGAPSFVEIAVSDTGIGIPPEHLPHILDRFYQADHARAREGIGIGLALVKELAELHRGGIFVESDEGKGTTCVVRLPTGKAHLRSDEIAGDAPFAPRQSVLRGASASTLDLPPASPCVAESTEEPEDETTVLVVEDHADVRAFLRDHLRKHYRVVEAQNGAEGLEQALASLPDLVLSDVMMQPMDGYELCSALKSHESTCHIPVVLLTAKAARDDKLAGLDTGADCYLIKPFDALELLLQVRNLIEQRRRLRERFSGPVVLKPSEMGVTPMDEAFLNKVLQVVQDHMHDADFDVERLGREVGLSRSQLHRKLRALTNQSPTLMIRAIRLQRAAELLARKTGSVAEIAYFVGFSSQAYFAKCFREQFGCSPREYAPSVSASRTQAGVAVEAARGDASSSAPRSPSRPWPVRRRA